MTREPEDAEAEIREDAESWLDKHFEPLFFELRYVILVPALASFVGALFVFALGVYEVYLAFTYLLVPDIDLVTLNVIRAVDIFLVGLVLIIFSYGIYDLFISPLDPARSSDIGPDWMRFNDAGELKTVIVEVVLVILVILFFEVVRTNVDALDTPASFLVIPLGILLIAVGIGAFKKLTH